MIDTICRGTPYGEVLEEHIHLKHPRTFLSLVKDLSSVSFCDCSVDSKGAAFEYYVRATLKGKKLGQYFTPRELVRVMSALVGRDKIVNALLTNTDIKVLDPACGTGGFLVYLMQDAIKKVNEKYNKGEIILATRDSVIERLKTQVFYGSDANEGVAASAKMNMIIAGDGHTNIRHEDSLSVTAANWSVQSPDCSLILTNPPFGTSEADSLSQADKLQFGVSSTKGQYLFIQKMIDCAVPGGEICTVIDEGVLNTDSGADLRAYILRHCRIKAIINLPSETFKPNKINVRASLLYIEKRAKQDDFEDHYKITIARISSLGYQGSGDKIRGFDFDRLISEIESSLLNHTLGVDRAGEYWDAHDIDSQDVYDDVNHRFDYKYWNPATRKKIGELKLLGNVTIADLNSINTIRGRSPSPDSYVDETDGYALVVKAGNINRLGDLSFETADWIEKNLFDEYVEFSKTDGKDAYVIKKNDVLLASTGDGTLGKCCVYTQNKPAIPDGHVTVIRVDPSQIDPFYLADYLRLGFGAKQIERLYTGSTGLIELTPDQVDSIVVDLKSGVSEQKRLSKQIRGIEKSYIKKLSEAEKLLNDSKSII